MTQYVYCLSNPDYTENLYKIGYTNNPVKRADELYSTGVPTNFIIEFVIKTPDGKLLEKIIHDKLKDYRHNSHREFFRIPMPTLKNILETELNWNAYSSNLFGECQIELIDKLPEKEKDNTTHFECECGSNVCISHKARHLKSEKHLNFVNKVEPKQKASTVVYCGCGKTFSVKNKTHHNKTKCHIDWLTTTTTTH